MQVGWVKTGNFRQITRYNSKTSTVVTVVNLVRSQAYSVHLCSQHVCRDAARGAGSSATAGTCFKLLYLVIITITVVLLRCNLVFTARRNYASAVLRVVIPSVCLSVCPSVCLSHACFVTNPKNLPAIFYTT